MTAQMIFGEYIRRVSRGRMHIPSGWCHHFEAGLELTLGQEKKFIFIVAYPYAKTKRRRVNSVREFQRLDRRGRITIPKAMRDTANIRDYVILLGANDRLEIWNGSMLEEKIFQQQQEYFKSLGRLDVQFGKYTGEHGLKVYERFEREVDKAWNKLKKTQSGKSLTVGGREAIEEDMIVKAVDEFLSEEVSAKEALERKTGLSVSDFLSKIDESIERMATERERRCK